MYWTKILKNDVREGGKNIGPSDQSGAFTFDMFNRSNWREVLHKLISADIKGADGEDVRSLTKVAETTINVAGDYYFTLLNSLLEHTDYGSKIEEAYETHSEEPKLHPKEHEISEPKSGDKGAGMMPKKVEKLTRSIDKGIEKTIELMMKKIHEMVDKIHARDKNKEFIDLNEEFSIGPDGDLSEEIKDTIWNEVMGQGFSKALINTTISEFADVFEAADMTIDNTGLNSVMRDLQNKEETKEFLTHLFVLLSHKISRGMAGMSPKKLERTMEDILTPEELQWMEDNAEDMKIDLGPMGQMDAGRAYPEVDESTGIPKQEQRNPETGERYYVPRDIGRVSDVDFDPADEVFEEHDKDKAMRRPSTSNAPTVEEYDPEAIDPETGERRGRMRTPPEWEQWQEKYTSNDLSQIGWFDILKEE